MDISFEKKIPPEFLYHGTASRFLDDIMKQGLKPMSRQYVHLSENLETATEVGKRYGKVVILKINALDMSNAGFNFYQSDNKVWLIDAVPINYLSQS